MAHYPPRNGNLMHALIENNVITALRVAPITPTNQPEWKGGLMATTQFPYLEGIIEEFGDNEIKHYGVKGMRWGVRRRRSESSSTPVDPQPVTIRQNHKTKGLQAAGGAGHKPSDDALTAIAIRQKAKASGAASLSNKEMETLVKRMNLEANYAKVMAANPAPQTKLAKGRKKLQGILKSEMNAAFKGQKGPYANFLGVAVGLGKEQVAKTAAKKAAKKGAATAATKVLVGRVVN